MLCTAPSRRLPRVVRPPAEDVVDASSRPSREVHTLRTTQYMEPVWVSRASRTAPVGPNRPTVPSSRPGLQMRRDPDVVVCVCVPTKTCAAALAAQSQRTRAAAQSRRTSAECFPCSNTVAPTRPRRRHWPQRPQRPRRRPLRRAGAASSIWRPIYPTAAHETDHHEVHHLCQHPEPP